jgi:hypothetical protein
VVVAAAAGTAGTAGAADAPQLVLAVDRAIPSGELAAVAPGTLAPLREPLPLRWHLAAATFAPDRGRMSIARGDPVAVRVVDLLGWRIEGDVPIAARGVVAASAWLGPRVLAVLYRNAALRLALVDPVERRVLSRHTLPGDVGRAAYGGGYLAALLQPLRGIGTARLAVVDTQGAVRVLALPGVRAGLRAPRTPQDAGVISHPGLAVDPDRGRALVFAGAAAPVEADLRTGVVTTRSVRAVAKSLAGSFRTARWLGGGFVGVTGDDWSASVDAQGRPVSESHPAGVAVIDTRTWQSRLLDPGSRFFRLAGGLVLVPQRSGGLRAYRPDGTLVLSAAARETAGITAAVGRWAYAQQRNGVLVVDLATGKARFVPRPAALRVLSPDEQPP